MRIASNELEEVHNDKLQHHFQRIKKKTVSKIKGMFFHNAILYANIISII